MDCSTFFQPFIDWLNTPPDPGTGCWFNFVRFLVAGNRSEANRFVLYMDGSFDGILDSGLSGSASQYFSDRRALNGTQPFDVNQIDKVKVTLAVPNGPLVFRTETDTLVAQFSTLECTDSGLLVCTSDFDRTIIVMSLQNDCVPLPSPPPNGGGNGGG